MSVVQQFVNYVGFCTSPAQKENKRQAARVASVEQQALIIADYIHKRQVLGGDEPPPDRISEMVGCLVKDFLSANSKALSTLTEFLEGSIREGKSQEEVIQKVFDSMFSDGKINWGRVGATYAFGVKFSKMYKSLDINGNNKAIPDKETLSVVGKYVGEKLGWWIRSQGGWEEVTKLYPNQELLAKQLRSAGYLVLTVGLGSLFNALTS